MIRDPSGGSVREGINPDANKINAVAPKTLAEEINGLPAGSQRAASLARLDRSREWLRNYRARKGYPQKSKETAPSGLPD